MKKNILLSLALLFGAGQFVFAQDKPNRLPIAEKTKTEAQRNSERLALTDEQKLPFKSVLDKYAKKKRDVNTSELLLKQKQDSVEKLMIVQDKEVKLLLTAEQFKIYKEVVDEKRQKLEAARERRFKLPAEK